MDANLGHKPFIYWRGILWGKSLLSKDLGWKVEDDTQISTNNNNWLTGNNYYKLNQPQNIPTNLIEVVELIDVTT